MVGDKGVLEGKGSGCETPNCTCIKGKRGLQTRGCGAPAVCLSVVNRRPSAAARRGPSSFLCAAHLLNLLHGGVVASQRLGGGHALLVQLKAVGWRGTGVGQQRAVGGRGSVCAALLPVPDCKAHAQEQPARTPRVWHHLTETARAASAVCPPPPPPPLQCSQWCPVTKTTITPPPPPPRVRALTCVVVLHLEEGPRQVDHPLAHSLVQLEALLEHQAQRKLRAGDGGRAATVGGLVRTAACFRAKACN